ncbi:hypothetical protein JTB14_034158 [Gonioctena quinquepunctata]|nr:hypothetical protein JTB14_034158 [Gonioctena quinquepunctata]
MYKTGGGPPAPVVITKTDFQVKELLGVAVTGLTNPFDDDSCNQPQQVIEEIIIDHDYIHNDDLNDNNLDNETVHEETSAELQWSSWNPSDLRRRTSSPLRVEGAVEDPHTSGCAGNIKGKNAKAAKKRSRSDITQECRFKISAMSQAKIELAHVQMDAIKQEIDLKKKEFNLKKCHWEEEHNLKMRQNEEEHDLKIQKLNIELLLLKKELENNKN